VQAGAALGQDDTVTAPSITEVRVRFAETDAQGIVHNSVYLVWFELARVEYLERHAGGYPTLRTQGIESFVTESRVRYLAPARFDERLTIRTSCRDVRGARFRLTHRPTRVPAWLAEAIARAEARG
jgi:acyl-CoA thioester hydrolase